MAYLAQLGALTDELVASLAAAPDTTEGRKRQAADRESALRGIRFHSFLRTNQFDVDDQLKGYDERFRVIGRESLADALNERLTTLEVHRNKFTPDVLRFILELADQPAQKADLRNLDLLYESGDEDEAPRLTWQDIAKEDGWNEDRAIWRSIDYSPSSEDEDEKDRSAASDDESLTTDSSADGEFQRTAEDLVVKPTDEVASLELVRESQAWRYANPARDDGRRAKKIPISSLQLLREVLFMLGGLETTLFNEKCDPVINYQLSGVSWDTYNSLVTSFSECGRKLAPLRGFAATTQRIPLLQVFQDSLQRALASLDRKLSTIQQRFTAVEQDAAVTLMGVTSELGPALSPLYSLSSIVQQLQEERNPHAFRYLELLFDGVGIAQLEGNTAAYELLGNIFFDCFQVYLKPIRLWMEEGKLLPGDRTFFVSESSTKLPLPQVWKSQFNLLRTPEGTLHAPRFLRPAIHRIFTTGKSIVVLKHLKHREPLRGKTSDNEPKMDFASVCPGPLGFAPFSELFSAAFQTWIQSKHHTASATLRGLLFNSYGLSQGLDALEYIYLMSDGSKAVNFASAIFRHLDSLSVSWKDRFTLSEIAQEAFSPSVEGHRLSAEIDSHAVMHNGLMSRSSVRLSLPAIRLIYRLNWPIQIIVPEDAVTQGYQPIFAFLLQTRRAISVLSHPILGFSASGSADEPDRPVIYHLVRTKLLWFCNTIMTYLTSLVLAPNTAKLRESLREAPDVDDMISAHSNFIARLINEACQGAKLQPIRECILDVFDLAIKVEDAHRAELTRLAEEEEEITRLSVMSSPFKASSSTKGRGRRSLHATPKKKQKDDNGEDDDDDDSDWEAELRKSMTGSKNKPILKDLHADFERHLRFVAGGLRGAARASRDEAAAKWDLLGEMLEVGIRD
ncbi:Spc98 family-domain-containing protein [Cercophora newfieldiana]|uniref:Spindle pole body component n=1 Tax=Cercophora newfieldiana TaxID=92897 RepID=A0AA39YGJ4_9PEZI|nr:Spc98 family-domain-containing protein [Cercophora newfieldiana]